MLKIFDEWEIGVCLKYFPFRKECCYFFGFPIFQNVTSKVSPPPSFDPSLTLAHVATNALLYAPYSKADVVITKVAVVTRVAVVTGVAVVLVKNALSTYIELISIYIRVLFAIIVVLF